jgi:hypothetical protein
MFPFDVNYKNEINQTNEWLASKEKANKMSHEQDIFFQDDTTSRDQLYLNITKHLVFLVKPILFRFINKQHFKRAYFDFA